MRGELVPKSIGTVNEYMDMDMDGCIEEEVEEAEG